MRLDRLFAPRTVAVVGATDRPGSYGAQVLANLVRAGWSDRVLGVHPTRREVLGVRCVPTLLDLDQPADAVVVATPASSVADVLDQAGRTGCGGAVVLAAGFGEVGRSLDQDRLVEVARRHGLPVIGPNANGLVCVAARAPLWGDPVRLPDAAGPIGLISQSGNLGVIALAHRAGAGLHTVVSLGNAAVVDAPMVIGQLAERPGVRCVAAYLEDDGDGERLARALAGCADRDVRLVVLKAGRTAAGRAAGAAHTAALSSDNAAFRALLEEAGGVLVATPHELFETARALAGGRRHPGALAVLTASGGDAAIAADLAGDLAVDLAALTGPTRAALQAALPPTATVTNPLDHTNLVWADGPAIGRIAAALAADPEVGHLIYVQDEPPGLPPADRAEWAATRDGALAGAAAGGVPAILVATTPGQEPPGAVAGLGAALAAVRALRRLPPDPDRLHAVAGACARVRGRAGGGWLAEHAAKDLLQEAGIPVPERAVVPLGDPDLVVAAAQRIGWPVALKLSAPGLLHKARSGALALDVTTPQDAVAQAARLAGLADRPGCLILVERMVRPGLELFVAARADGVVPTLVIGLGGGWAEALDDVVVLALPVTAGQVLDGLDRLRARSMLGPRAALAGFAELAAAVGDLVLERDLALVELNPVIVRGPTVVAVDAVLRGSGRPDGATVA